jgi:hypothetical protein
MRFSLKKGKLDREKYELDTLQRFALGGLLVLTIMTFIGTNIEAVMWRSSHWLVSSVLPSVVVNLTNDERADEAKPALRRNTTLDAAAQMKANDMAKRGYFSHYAPDGTSPWYWFDQAGYKYAHAGENLAVHFTDSSEVVEAWMNSPKHRENIVNGKFTEIGVGTAKGKYEGYNTVFVVQLFGTPTTQTVVKTTQVAGETKTSSLTPTTTDTPVNTRPAVTSNPTSTPEIPREETVLANENTTPAPVEVTAREEDEPETASSSEIVVVPATGEQRLVSAEDPENVIVETELISTSSGLAIANIDTPVDEESDGRFGFITQPNTLLKIVYALFGFIVVGLLIASVAVETKKSRYVQVAYSIGLLVIMAGLWYVNMLLTSGATIV